MKNTVIQFIHNIREGGAETLVKDYALLMDKDRVNIIIVTLYPPEKDSSNYRLLKENNIKIYTLVEKYPFIKPLLFQKIWNRFFFVKHFAQKLLDICKEEQACCIHVHLDLLKFLAPISKELLGIKLVYTCHSLPSRYLNQTDKKSELKAAKKLIKNNDLLIVALHGEMKKELSELLHTDNVIVVPNGVDFSLYKNINESKSQIREALSIPEQSFVIGHVGRFSYMKNHQFLIQVFIKIFEKKPEAFLLLIGDGPTKEEVELLIKKNDISDKVLILSHRSDIPRLLKSMDVFIFPSQFEGLPVSIVEAQLSSLRVLMSNTITTDCVFNTNVILLDINESPSAWAEAALNDKIKGDISKDITPFDMANVIKQLEYIYTNNEYN